ncbi:MAG TPA: alpha/beta hydrolase [Candidatus Dormibacteraeota bacterium]|nr:alpha/beta hydrolase [Candidatus Dormibacteraeota bacterium]
MIPAHRIRGRGPTLLLSHGVIESSRSWAEVAEALEDRFTVVAVDGRGRGETPASGPFTYADLAEDVEDLARRLGLTAFFHAGHSMGGRVALEHALRFPGRARGLAVISARAEAPDAAGRERLRRLAAVARERGPGEAVGLWTSPEDAHHGRVRAISAANPAEGTALALEAIASADSLLERLGEVGVPTLVVAGDRDPAYVRSAELMARAIPGARLHVLEGVGHFPNLEAPVELAALLAGFFGGLG